MSTYVLVHGACQGEWVWDRVKPELESLGHKVVTLDLPGSGKDMTPPQEVTLDLYVDKVVNAIKQQNEDVILVGHSMGGVVITQTAEYVSDKLDKLVYLCAFLPRNGESLAGKSEGEKGPKFEFNEKDMTLAPAAETVEPTFFNAVANEELKQWAMGLCRPQPLVPFQQEVSISDDKFGSVERVYIETTLDQAIPIEFQRRMNTETTCKTILTMEADHAPFLSKTDELVRHLHELSQ
ncbi:alpha/beta fold hydrolase [Paenibacillus sp. GCM10027627]|uniref:alpha/beta fold hydrolase n=1 Tax=unclassified Paenibacillus TaxID=185978 RepID=UPI00362F2E4F